MGALTSTSDSWFPFSFEARRRTLESIDAMGISEKKRTPIRLLSGGQQRRVATARTLAQRPEIILADEFLGELDEETMESVLTKVTNYVRTNNATLIVVEHDITRAKRMADRLLILDDGRLNPFVGKPIAVELTQ
jgi:energy-coupling factor transporter ATP-binding protein EcfA2